MNKGRGAYHEQPGLVLVPDRQLALRVAMR